MAVNDKVVVVGGASGIGAALVSRLIADDTEVTVLDRAESSHGTHHIKVDLRDRAAIDGALSELADQDVDGVAYVAGLPGTWPDKDVLAVNFLAMRHLLEGIVPRIRGGGAVVVVASTAGGAWQSRTTALEGLLSTPSFEAGLDWAGGYDGAAYPMYSTSKEASIIFAKRWAYPLWTQHGIRINTVSPGPVETPILGDFEQSMGKAALDGVRTVVGRHGTVEDIAPVLSAVLSADFGWVTGQDIQADGGFTAAYASGAISF
ncbi:SDR family oxidoreductase [Microbacterium rhizomatis]|uniref:SDR family oxidoreductase n=1 Tax=Microbacterium rhizomatis TaxID=1631477 RepID=A0A5J5IZ46_9MICO|nr:SDR family oxidoreductase [Microbacterium rhizomatis]KAA9105933.1 SDR family oxidoreductase [Microbacterium rhizomatis]